MGTESVKSASLPPPVTTERGRAGYLRPSMEKAEQTKGNSEGDVTIPTGSLRVPPDEESDTSKNAKELAQAVLDISQYIQNTQRNLEFDIDETSGRTVIRVMDAESEKLVRQIPAEEVLVIARSLKEASDEQREGLIFQERV